MYHAIQTLSKWIQGRHTELLEDILGAIALFAMLFIGLFFAAAIGG